MKDVAPSRYFLDSVTGDVGCVENPAASSLPDKSRYFEIPKTPAVIQIGTMEQFIKDILATERGGKKLANRLKGVIKKKQDKIITLSECEKILEVDKGGWGAAWQSWQGDSLFEDAKIWLSRLPVSVEERWEGGDDCELCKLMNNGADLVTDLKEAMAEENKKGAIVGGVWDALESVADEYYDALDLINSGHPRQAEKLLLHLLKSKPEYVPAYECLSYVYRDTGNLEKEKKYVRLAYAKTLAKYRKWQKELIWGYTEHRPYLRSILGMATLFHAEDNKREAEKLYRDLLKANPYDNQGVRYLLAALFAGWPPEKADELTEEGNELQDWTKMEVLLAKQNKKHKFWKEPREE